ncbi:MAG: sulfatase-like hydrolase/transferase [Deltaproteobacteria bacterium]|nr:sulfatase-like hydrolase/transferase [Deltaproteobacteria bacterium]
MVAPPGSMRPADREVPDAPLPASAAALAGLAGGFVGGVADAAITLLSGGLELSTTAEAVAAAAGSTALVWVTLSWASVAAWLLVAGVARVARAWWSREAVATAIGIVASGSAATWIAVGLSEGRRLRALPLRLVVIAGAAFVGVAGAWLLAKACLRLFRTEDERPRALAAAFASLVATAALVVDVATWRRLYLEYHVGLALIACTLFLVAGVLAVPSWGAAARARRLRRTDASTLHRAWGAWVALSVATFAAALGWKALALRPNARLVVLDHAPLAGKITALVARRDRGRPRAPQVVPVPRPPVAPVAHVQAADAATAPALDLAGADVLVITVDALRADALGSYGRSPSPTPALDELAADGVVFERAYCPTPHTSYSVASLWTSTYLRSLAPLDELRGRPTLAARPTLASLLRRAGYRTAAFFSPSVFYVDSARFSAIERNAFGFEHVVRDDAPGRDRPAAVAQWLDGLGDDDRVLVWVHLFEPHEPYTPSRPFGEANAFGRYLGEVRDTDATIGALVDGFRRRRPRSVVVVTSDHGEEFGEHGGRFHGTTLHDEQVRVPLLLSAPGVPSRRVATVVETLDLTTTLLPLLGVAPDPRMRGDDLSGLIGPGEPREPAASAFLEIGELRAVVERRDGVTWKLLCDQRVEEGCRLFDLTRDPVERTNLAGERGELVRDLRAELDAWAESHAVVERDAGASWPVALVRAATGDARATPALVPLLGSERTEVRRSAARLLGEAGYVESRAVLSRMRRTDPDERVRREAAIAALALGDVGARDTVVDVAVSPAVMMDERRRAALVLGRTGSQSGVAVLLGLALDAGADLEARTRAIRLIGDLRARSTAQSLLPLLTHPTLRTATAETLGRLGDRSVAPGLRAALAQERYPAARVALVDALVALRDRRAAELVRGALGIAEPVPNGVAALAALDGLRQVPWGADLRAARRAPAALVEGAWQCRGGCLPGEGARIVARCTEGERWRLAIAHDGAGEIRLGRRAGRAGAPGQLHADVVCAGGVAAAEVVGGARVIAVVTVRIGAPSR